MIELAKHIEILLLENDCVIIPNFGGFIVHYSVARRVEEERLFLPPIRTIGFNPQLKINDGLLVQSYMQVYDTNFSDATKRIEKAVDKLTITLQEEGKIELEGIGELVLKIDGNYEFHPNEDGVLSPEFYGLSSFCMTKLEALPILKEEKKEVIKEEKEVYEIKINRSFLRQSVAAAAAVIVFFFMSTPAENTYIEKDNYAQLVTANFLEVSKSKPIETVKPAPRPIEKAKETVVVTKETKVNVQQRTINLRPRVVKTEKVMKAAKTEETAKPIVAQKLIDNSGQYNIIVGSVIHKEDAQKMVDKLKSQGYTSASVVEGNGRARISILSFSDKKEANKKLSQLRKEASFENAWLLTK
ncbi:MAG: SPOR domain-containing protein [Bacteroidaceae bacterium]